MELRIQYNKDIQLPATAALLQGNSTVEWLKQISRWQVDSSDLTCYILPQSVGSVKPAALFVIFNNPALAKDIDLLHPYNCIGNRLYIPCNASLFPQITAAEFDQLLLWPMQVFHPSIGLVGFEDNSQVNIEDLFIYPQVKNTGWTFADPGLATKPPLQQILVTPLAAETIMDEIKTGIGQKPIERASPSLSNVCLPILPIPQIRDLHTLCKGRKSPSG